MSDSNTGDIALKHIFYIASEVQTRDSGPYIEMQNGTTKETVELKLEDITYLKNNWASHVYKSANQADSEKDGLSAPLKQVMGGLIMNRALTYGDDQATDKYINIQLAQFDEAFTKFQQS